MCTRKKDNKGDFWKKTEKGTKKRKTNIYCFYNIILLFESIQEGRAQIFFSLMRTQYVKRPLRILRPGDKIALKKRYFHFKI